MFSYTAVFIAVFCLFQLPITIAVGMHRNNTGIMYLHQGDERLLRKIRAHANFTETVPITLLAMAAAEYSGASSGLLLSGGLSLLLGRIIHVIVTYGSGEGILRAVSMLFTFVSMISFAVFAVGAQFGTW